MLMEVICERMKTCIYTSGLIVKAVYIGAQEGVIIAYTCTYSVFCNMSTRCLKKAKICLCSTGKLKSFSHFLNILLSVFQLSFARESSTSLYFDVCSSVRMMTGASFLR